LEISSQFKIILIRNFFQKSIKGLIDSSDESFDDAVKSAVAEVSKNVKNIDSFYVKDFKVPMHEGKIKSYSATMQIIF